MKEPIETKWLVEETDFLSGSVVFSITYENESFAKEEYAKLKSKSGLNTVSIQKLEKFLLQE